MCFLHFLAAEAEPFLAFLHFFFLLAGGVLVGGVLLGGGVTFGVVMMNARVAALALDATASDAMTAAAADRALLLRCIRLRRVESLRSPKRRGSVEAASEPINRTNGCVVIRISVSNSYGLDAAPCATELPSQLLRRRRSSFI